MSLSVFLDPREQEEATPSSSSALFLTRSQALARGSIPIEQALQEEMTGQHLHNAPTVGGAAHAPYHADSRSHEERNQEDHHHHYSSADTHRSPLHAPRHGFGRSSSSSSRSRSRSPRRFDDSFQQQQHHQQQQPDLRLGHDQLSLEVRARGYGDHHPPPPPLPSRWYHHQSHEAHFNDGPHHHHHQIRDAPPSSKLIVRGLSPNVTERMIMDALAAFRPLLTRIIYDKATGESRGLAFVEFPSIEDAKQVVLAYSEYRVPLDGGYATLVEVRAGVDVAVLWSFSAHGPLFLDNRPLAIGFTDNNRPNRWFGGEGDQQPLLPGAPSRVDWICTECNGTNFAKRSVCFKCEAPRAEQAREVPPGQSAMFTNQMSGGGPPGAAPAAVHAGIGGAPSAGSGHRHYENEPELPTQVLLVRDLPEHIEEGELHVAFAEFDGVNDIRLIRDRVTNLTRGFGFVEFVDAESAEKALNSCGNLRVHAQQVRVSFARDSRFSKQHAKTSHHHPPSSSRGTHTITTVNSMTSAALEQAQWSLANGYSGSAQQEGRQSSSLDADVDAFLESAVAAVGASYVERPKKQWPQPFETGGGSYVFASDCGLYYDPDSMFYYDTQSKLYCNAYRGTYYQCRDGAKGVHATFSPFVPPVPADDITFSGPSDPAAVKRPSASPADAGTAIGGFSLTLHKKEKKKPIAIHIKTATTTGSSKLKDAFASSSTTVVVGAAMSGTSVGMKRKSAEDIAKWSQLQRASKGDTDGTETAIAAAKTSSSPSATTPRKPISTEAKSPKSAQKTEVDNLVNAVTVEAPICLLCRRKFVSMDLLRKHETLSKLHLENLAKARANKEVLAAQYRDIEHERNDRKRQRAPSQPAAALPAAAQQPMGSGTTPSASVTQQPKEPTPSASSSLESGIGGKMLKMMGWKSGEGLGKHGTGITTPVATVGNFGNEMAGLGARSTNPPPIDQSDMASYKERLQQMARARYDSNPRGL